jgi:PBP1b-binding outer membrane lipoprotein LpoB
MLRIFALAGLTLALAACTSGKTRRVDIADDDIAMGTGIESGDVEAVESLAKSLMELPELTGPEVEEVPVVAIHPIKNNTSQDFDAELFVRRIRQQLVEHSNGRIRFVTRDQFDHDVIDSERDAKREGEYTSTRQETKIGVDFYLTGTASSLSKVGKGMESNAFWLDFRLMDAENGAIVWEKGYKTKKVGEAGMLYR